MKKFMMKKMCDCVSCLEKPSIKKKIDASLDIYPSKNASKALFSAKMDGDWQYSLCTALKVMAAIMAIIYVMCAISRLMHKIF